MSETRSFDAIVIGEGLAGFAAATALHEAGKSVAVVSRGPGATSVSSGIWDCGPVQSSEPFEVQCQSSIWKALRLPEAALWKKNVEAVLAHFGEELAMAVNWKSPFVLASTDGRLRSAFIAQGTQAPLDVASGKIRRVSVMSSRRWRFRGDFLSGQWNESAKRMGLPVEFRAVDLPLEGEGWDVPLPRVAADLQALPGELDRLADAVGRAGETADALLFPPVFSSRVCFDRVAEMVGGPVGEAVCSIEPTAGYRLAMAMRARLKVLGIERLVVQQLKVQPAGESLRDVTALFSGKEGWATLKASTFVLATGRYFGGGLVALPHRIEESVFGLLLAKTDWEKVGVQVDAQFRPVVEDGRAAFQNLHACGALLGGIDYPKEGVGLGYFAHTGRQSVASAL